jgi:SSS family transporter
MHTLAAVTFSLLDWCVLLGYFAVLAVTGWWFSRKELAGAREYFLANRQMPMWAVAISVLATSTSAATFIGSPEEGYARNLTYLSTNIGGVIAVLIVARFFIPIYYKHNVMTVYDLLEVRFGHAAKEASSWMFMIGRVMASGSRLFMAAIPLSLILFHETKDWQLLAAIAVLTLVGIFYTLVGGIRSIIYTDVIQFAVFMLAAVAAVVVLLMKIPAPIGEVWSALSAAKAPDGSAKLSILRFDTDPTVVYTIFTAAIGFAMLNLASYGTDHDIAQRMLTCKSALEGSRSVILAILLNLPMQLIFLSIGVLLWVFYTRPDLMGGTTAGAPEKSGEVFVRFILDHMPSGMAGVMMAGLFAAGLGSFNSALNAMGATFVNDVYAKRVKGKSDRHYLVVGRWAVVVWGFILGAFAGVCVWWQKGSGETLISFALGIMTFAYAGLLAVFVTALFTRRGNSASAIAALAVGFLATLVMQPVVWNAIPIASLSDMTIAWPWRFVIATALALGVSLMGRSPATSTHLRSA